MMEKFSELPENAQYVVMAAGGLIALLFVILIVVLIIKMISGGGSAAEEKVKVPKRLPISPLPLMTLEESALFDALTAVARRHKGYTVFPKIGTQAIVGARPDEYPKIRKAIQANMIKDVHDYVMFDRENYPVAVIEYESSPKDKREEQARKAGIPLVRITDARMTPNEIEERMHGIFKNGLA